MSPSFSLLFNVLIFLIIVGKIAYFQEDRKAEIKYKGGEGRACIKTRMPPGTATLTTLPRGQPGGYKELGGLAPCSTLDHSHLGNWALSL